MNELDAEQREEVSESKDDAKLPKHLRLRYWNNWEEAKLIELWRRYSAEVVTLAKNIPVFRTISDCMRECGFYVNPQECRRKINSMKNKYIQERRRLELSDEYHESEWRLYPLVHCLLVPKQKNADLMHQVKIVNDVLGNLPPMQTQISTSETMQQLECNFPGPKTASKILNNGILCVPPPRRPYVPRPRVSNTISIQTMAFDTITVSTQLPPPPTRAPASAFTADHNGVNYLLKHVFTEERLEQLREDNVRLTDQRNDAINHLKIEEKEFRFLETFLQRWQQEQEALLQRLLRTTTTAAIVDDCVVENNTQPADCNTVVNAADHSITNPDACKGNAIAAVDDTTEK